MAKKSNKRASLQQSGISVSYSGGNSVQFLHNSQPLSELCLGDAL